jgi:sulfoxide reductase heme-binding subunit YedZ
MTDNAAKADIVARKAMQKSDLIPWRDRAGRFSPLRATAFAAAVLPSAWVVLALFTGRLDAEPLKHATHLTGTWALYFLLAPLAVTPLKGLLGWSRLIGIRRLLGLAAFAYLAAHLGLYVWYQSGDLAKVAGEIASRIYLTIGFVALSGFALLAATSFDAAIRRLRRNWKRLHRAVYPLTALGLLHFFMQSKSDVSEAVLLTGIFIALLLHRIATPRAAALRVALVAIAAGLAAAALEYTWYAAMTGLPAERILLANLDLSSQVRPAWAVMAICAAPLAVIAARAVARQARPFSREST